MGPPVFDISRVPFSAGGLTPRRLGDALLWPLAVDVPGHPETVRWIEAVSMGNPHAVQEVPDAEHAPVRTQGPLIENHPRFPSRVNAGFMQVVSRSRVRLRVWERGVGETLACGTGACAAVVAGIRAGRLDAKVDVETRGGVLTIEWAGEGPDGMAPVLMAGPAVTVFEGEIEVPDSL